MNKVFVSAIVVTVILAGVLMMRGAALGNKTVLIPSTLSAAASSSAFEGELNRIQVVGRVANLPIDYELTNTPILKFSINDPGKSEGDTVAVVYNGPRPDMFAPGRDVIIDGNFRDGILSATNLVTQCPSKYEAPDPATKYRDNSKSPIKPD